jgi:hypothetical protein
MRRPQFSLKSFIWLMLVIASFFSGASWQRCAYQHDRQRWELNRRDFTKIVVDQHEQIDSMDEQLQGLRQAVRSSGAAGSGEHRHVVAESVQSTQTSQGAQN